MTETDRWYLSGPLGVGTQTPRRALDVAGEVVATNRMTLAQDGGNTTKTWHLANSADCLRVFDQPNINTPGTERLVIAGANVGVGTGTPRRALDVAGEVVATNRMTLAQDGGTTTKTWHLDNSAGSFRIFEQPNINTSGSERFTIAGNTVTITGSLRLNGDLVVSGNASKTGALAWTAVSDEALKKEIAPIEDALGKLLELRGVSFSWRAPEHLAASGERQMGMIAQEVEKVFPQWVRTTADGIKGLQLAGFEALRELTARCHSLETELASLRAAAPAG